MPRKSLIDYIFHADHIIKPIELLFIIKAFCAELSIPAVFLRTINVRPAHTGSVCLQRKEPGSSGGFEAYCLTFSMFFVVNIN